MLVKFFCNTCVWVALMIVAFVLCIDIEYEWILFPGFSKGTAEATNRIMDYALLIKMATTIIVIKIQLASVYMISTNKRRK